MAPMSPKAATISDVQRRESATAIAAIAAAMPSATIGCTSS